MLHEPPATDPGSAATGVRLKDRYEILEELGAGSSARVFRATHLPTGRTVALKILSPRLSDATVASHLARFRREISLGPKLWHPNIVAMLDSGETDDGSLFVAFEHVPGATLREILAGEAPLSLAETVHLMGQVLDALACAHARGIVHRDLKPENLLVVRTGVRRHAMVLDFGLAGLLQDLTVMQGARITATQEMLGTPAYAAPEQLRGEPASARSDLYSWGLVFLECLTGELAVAGVSAQDVIRRQLSPEPVPIPDHFAGGRLETLLERVTAKSVDKRDISCEEIVGTLAALAAAEDVPASLASGFASETEPERRQLTIVSCRLEVERTAASDADVEALDAILHAHQDQLRELASRHRGEVGGRLANRMLLVFGYPHVRENDARRAARMALQIVAETNLASRQLEATAGLRVHAHVGIHSGVVVVREVRDLVTRRLSHLVGETPRIATMLDTLAPAGEALLSEETVRLLRDDADVEPASPSAAGPDGSAGPGSVHRLLAMRRGGGVGGSRSRGAGPLIGRQAQMEQLVGCWERARGGVPQATLILGEPGIGKSRLVRELRSHVEAERWLECRCTPEDQASPLRPIVELLRSRGEGLEVLIERSGMDLAETYPLLASLLGLPPDPRFPAPSLTPERQRELTLTSLVELTLREGVRHPIVLAIEDLHWVDPTTLQLVELLVQELASARPSVGSDTPRVLLLLTGRPEFHPSWPLSDTVVVLPPRLERAEVAALVAQGAATELAITDTLVDRIVERADGIPLFVEEVGRVLLESGAAEVRRDGSDPGEPASVEIPGTLRDLLAARLDGLSPIGRETAQLAAALGREFRADHLAGFSGHPPARLDEAFGELLEAGLIHRRRTGRDQRYVFKHALLAEAAYESMTTPLRQRVHARIGAALRQQFPEVERDRPDILAQHFEGAFQPEIAAEYWKRSGDRTMATGGYNESIRDFERGIRILHDAADPVRTAKLELGLAESLGTAFLATQGYGSTAAEAAFSRAIEACDRVGIDVPVRVLHGVWSVEFARGDEGAKRHLPRMHRLAERDPDPVHLLTAHAHTGLFAFFTGDFATARDEMAQATRWYRTDSYRQFVRDYGYDGGLYPFGYLAWALAILGEADRAKEVGDEMLALVEESRNPYGRAIACGFTAHLAAERGDLDRAQEVALQGIAHATDQKLYFWLAWPLCIRGSVAAALGDPDLGAGEIEQGIQILEMSGFRITQPYYYSRLAEAQFLRGDVDAAKAAVDRGLELCRTTLDRSHEAELHRLGAQWMASQGDLEQARETLASGRSIALRQGALGFLQRPAWRATEASVAGTAVPGAQP